MDRFAHLDWPFFESRHAELARRAESWAAANLGYAHDVNEDSVCRRLVKDLGAAGFLAHCAPEDSRFDVRSLAVLREVFAFHAGIADFVVDADAPGLSIEERIEIVAPHPMATLRFSACKVPAANLLGAEGEGFKLAMRTLDIFRTGVAAAALGFARRALAEALARARERKMFGQALADFQLTQAKLADMATGIDAAALLAYRAAWMRDVKQKRVTREAAMAKMQATETAQEVVDAAVQIFGGLGVMRGHPVEDRKSTRL